MIGIDVKIEALRARFASKLFADVVGNTYVSYGRAFITNRKDKDGRIIDVPELQIASTKKYQEVLPNRKIEGHSFFLVSSDIEVKINSELKADVSIYFSVNLDTLYPNVTERAVEYLHRDVLNEIRDSEFDVKKITTGLKAFENFGLVKETDNMEPFYLVRFDTEINYNQNC